MDESGRIAIDVALPRSSWSGALRRRVARLSRVAVGPLLYGAAAVSYVALGVFVNEFMLSWVVGFAWLLLWVWVLPAAVRRVRR